MADFAAGPWTLSTDYMFYHANGDVQTPGWNRLTQALIDNGTYITGRNTSLKDADGNGRDGRRVQGVRREPGA